MNLFSITIIGFHFNPYHFDFISIRLTTHESSSFGKLLKYAPTRD